MVSLRDDLIILFRLRQLGFPGELYRFPVRIALPVFLSSVQSLGLQTGLPIPQRTGIFEKAAYLYAEYSAKVYPSF